ncbi:MAG: hypothetical protein ACJATI_001897 [Halioglobus sp.]|jgi:hypothetical protein
MRIRLLPIIISLFIISCSKSVDEGFLGEWEGKTQVIVNGDPVESETEVKISDQGNLSRECEVTVNGLKYVFDATEGIDILTFTKEPAKNLSDSLAQTYITGSAELVGDTLLRFDHQIITMVGSAIISGVGYNLEFKRKE